MTRSAVVKPEYLVILGANLTALAVARSAWRLGVKPIVLDDAPGPAFDSRLVERVRRHGGSRAATMDAVVELGKRGPAWLVSSADAWTVALMARRAELENAFQRVLHPSNGALEVCLNKAAFASWCEAHKVPAPRAYPIAPGARAVLDDIEYPVLVRPADTLHSRPVAGIAKAFEAVSKDALEQYLARFREAGVVPVVTQSLLGRPVTQLGVGAACADGKILTVTTRKLRPGARACRVGTLVRTVDASDAEGLARDVLRKLDYAGIAEIEILRTDDDGRLYVIEVNARPWLQFELGAASGRDLLRFLLDGDYPFPQQTRTRERVWLDFSADLYSCFDADDGLVRKGKIGLKEYLASLWGADVFARWSIADPGPFLRDAARLFSLIARRLFRGRQASTTGVPT